MGLGKKCLNSSVSWGVLTPTTTVELYDQQSEACECLKLEMLEAVVIPTDKAHNLTIYPHPGWVEYTQIQYPESLCYEFKVLETSFTAINVALCIKIVAL